MQENNLNWKDIYEMWKEEFGENFKTEIETIEIENKNSYYNVKDFDWWKKEYIQEYKELIFEEKKTLYHEACVCHGLSRNIKPGMLHTMKLLKKTQNNSEKTALVWLSAYMICLDQKWHLKKNWSKMTIKKFLNLSQLLKNEMEGKKLEKWNSKEKEVIKEALDENAEREIDMKIGLKTQKDIIRLAFYKIRKTTYLYKIIEYIDKK
jgi:hypothetical protein